MCMLNHHWNTGMKLICGGWSKITYLCTVYVCVWTCHTAWGSQRTSSSSTMWVLWHYTKCLTPLHHLTGTLSSVLKTFIFQTRFHRAHTHCTFQGDLDLLTLLLGPPKCLPTITSVCSTEGQALVIMHAKQRLPTKMHPQAWIIILVYSFKKTLFIFISILHVCI